jgi:hypothetical protein
VKGREWHSSSDHCNGLDTSCQNQTNTKTRIISCNNQHHSRTLHPSSSDHCNGLDTSCQNQTNTKTRIVSCNNQHHSRTLHPLLHACHILLLRLSKQLPLGHLHNIIHQLLRGNVQYRTQWFAQLASTT